MPRKLVPAALLLVWFLLALACTRAAPGGGPWRSVKTTQEVAVDLPLSDEQPRNPLVPATREPGAPILTPTPDPARVLPTPRIAIEEYVVQPGDTLGQIATRYGVPLAMLIELNELTNPDLLEPGQLLTIPPPEPRAPGPGFKIIPDSELIYSPPGETFDVSAYVAGTSGYLKSYQEELDDEMYSGAEIVKRIAYEYSVNPRLLLAVLEYRSGWLTQASPPETSLDYPIQYFDQRRNGLYRQLAWAADNLNRGYYLWRVNGIPAWVLVDGAVIPASPVINAGTAGVQHFFSLLLNEAGWMQAVGENGLFATYNSLFNYPFDLAIEPVLPPDLKQPAMQLPFEPGNLWAFTGGPHGGWADGSAWAAIDFAPPGEPLGCVQSDSWVTAVTNGLIIRAGNGAVIQDIDGDGLESTGWTVLYMHIESRDRVQPGTFVQAGERIGHPSCEGGFSTGTHLHLARRYNGEWIPADGPLPFNLEGWISRGDGILYNGYLVKDGVSIEALEGVRTENQIGR
jgi:murein DD-endopeptidase MepM/ murein hydrolase activator NlpD